MGEVDEETMALDAAIGGAADAVLYLNRLRHLRKYDDIRAAAAQLRLDLRDLSKARESELDGSAADARAEHLAEARAGE